MAEQSAHEKYEFKKKLESLRDKKGRSTELISLYIPADKQIFDVTNQLKDEHGQAANIKSKLTRTNVQGAIESLLSRLRYLNKVPENGIVYFTGAVDIGANKTNMESEVIIPPEPITVYKYHCDSSFFLEPLEEMLKDKGTFGLLVLDRREATVGLLVGKRIQAFRNLTSTVPGKQRKGGQSSHRFQQLRLIAIHDFYKRIGDAADDIFLAVEPKDLKGILIGGPSPTKEEFYAGEFLHHELMRKILGLFDTAYTDESGLSELVNAAADKLQDLELMGQKNAVRAFFKELISDSGKVAYGETQVRANLEINSVEVLLLSEDLRAERVTTKCSVCGYENKWTRRWKPGESAPTAGNCPNCGASLEVTDVTDIVDELSALADKSNAKVIFVSTDFDEGSQLMNAFGGIAAILRYSTGV
ncbi:MULTISPECIES: peptide chain release factor aRF-1 [Methanosarcina]|jgi:peptide chain release factor subunit 1|uniref:Peptide chain release factor subunit 1 n=1 Tax=Methanosarcina vacuolata Z-761 TaxID=1434123 RepID=A0A0E3QA54_9EURY|nr:MULTISPECIES: peptide chain release factor aRF-1 [Methanosarcina]AKB45717.1 Eukaryotic peptide chain release factor subunit 1 [Methanosarcina vacuolata Z-761]MCC4765206.1 peptide chain release factor 1 [Methanosarcina sp. DH1]